VRFDWTPTAGSHTLRFNADCDNHVSESNESNNSIEKGVTIAGQPDLVVTDIKFYRPQTETEVTPVAGQLVTCKAILKNQGNASTGVFNVKWFLDNAQVGYGSHSNLDIGQTSNDNVRFDWTPRTKGKYTITFVSDCDNHAKESNENNNSYTKTVSINPNNKNLRPIAIISANPITGSTPLTVRFYGDKSYDPDGTITSYRWSFGDGFTSSKINPTHIYNNNTSKAKIYNATLVVTDSQGLSSAGRISITVYPKRK
jgi:subtilase family serine protease